MKFAVFRVVNNVQIVNQSASPAHSVTLIDLFHFSLDLKLKSNSINLNAFKRMSLFCWSSPPGGTRINQLIFNLTLQCVFIFHLKYVLTTVDWSARATVVSSFDFLFVHFDPNYSFLCFHWPIINCHFALSGEAIFRKLSHEYSNWCEWLMRRRRRIASCGRCKLVEQQR